MQHSVSWMGRYCIQVLPYLNELWSELPVAMNWLGQEKYCIALKSLVIQPSAALNIHFSILSAQMASPVACRKYPIVQQ